MKEAIVSLKKSIKQSLALAADCNRRIRESSGMDRWWVRAEKSARGCDARLLLLAYAAARGVPYRALERKCTEDGDARARDSLLAGIWTVLRSHGMEMDGNAVRSWMETAAKEDDRCAA